MADAQADSAGALRWEERFRRPAAIAAVSAGVLPVLSVFVLRSAQSKYDAQLKTLADQISKLDARRDKGAVQALQDRITGIQLRAAHEQLGVNLASSALTALAALAVAAALFFLIRAVAARREATPRGFVALPLVVGGLLCVTELILPFVISAQGAAYLAGPQTPGRAHDLFRSSGLLTASAVHGVAQLALAVAIVLTSINAMRVGLLTRYMGVLGAVVGATLVPPLSQFLPGPVIEILWLVALGALFAGFWPGGVPPAWRTGDAEPWPSRQEMIERAAAARGEAPLAVEPKPEPEPPPEPVAAGARPAGGARRKRKKRR